LIPLDGKFVYGVYFFGDGVQEFLLFNSLLFSVWRKPGLCRGIFSGDKKYK